jgi:hypothetical protein
MNTHVEEGNEFTKQIDILFSTATGRSKWNWLRRRTSKLIECENPGLYEIGSSDVSSRLYELWRERYRLTGTAAITDDLVWEINGRVKEYIW